jgi:hypothetical protein
VKCDSQFGPLSETSIGDFWNLSARMTAHLQATKLDPEHVNFDGSTDADDVVEVKANACLLMG